MATISAPQTFRAADGEEVSPYDSGRHNPILAFFTLRPLATATMADIGLLIMRIMMLPLMLHGIHKATGFRAFSDAAMATNPISAWAPDFMTVIVILAQIILPIMIFVGLFTRWAGLFVACVFAVIIFTVNVPTGGWIGKSGGLSFESSLFYFIPAIMLFFTGAGRISVDSILQRH